MAASFNISARFKANKIFCFVFVFFELVFVLTQENAFC